MIQLIELRSRQDYIALSVHGNDLLSVFAHEEMLAEDDVVEDAADTENVTDWLGLRGHIFDVDDLGGHVAWCSASDEEVIGVVGYRRQAEIDDDGLLAENDVVGLQVTMDHILPCHLGQSSQNALHDEFPFINCVFGEVVEPSADGVAIDELKSKIDGVF